jgi:hypothetical protein
MEKRMQEVIIMLIIGMYFSLVASVITIKILDN